MSTRTIKDGPFCWQSKAALRRLRDAFDATNDVSTALAVYIALTEIASNEGVETFTAAHAWIARLSGVGVSTVKKHVKTLAEVGLIAAEVPKLRAPARFTLLSVGQPLPNDSQPMASVSQRSDFGSLATDEERERTQTELLPGVPGEGTEKPKKERKPRQHDPCFDAIAEAFGYFGENRAIAKSNAALVNKTLGEIRTVCPTVAPEDIRRRVANLRLRFENTSPAALSKWWNDCATPPAPAGRPAQPEQPIRFVNSRP